MQEVVASMETDSAAFINMLMERLQTLEAASQKLQDTVPQLDVQCTNAELYFEENTEFQGLQFVEDDEDPYGHNYIMKVSL